MSGKFINVKRLVVPTITLVLIASQLMGCAAASQSELLQMIQNGESIEIEVAKPAFATEEQGTETSIQWIELASLTTNPDLRKSWDDTLMIKATSTGKNGVLYVDTEGNNDNNNTLRVALHNREFQKFLENESSLKALVDAVSNQYVDIDDSDVEKVICIGINGYFNLLPDNEVNYSNADATLQRNEFMAMVFRADTPVQEIDTDSSFEALVGSSDYNVYAQGVAGNSYLDTASKSLNNLTYNGAITRAEAVYIVMNRYFGDELGNVDIKSASFSDAKDGGNIADKQKFAGKDYSRSYELTYAIQNPDDGLPSDLYKALVLANNKGLIGSETRWDEAITKAEALELIVDALKQDSTIDIFNAQQGALKESDVTLEENDETSDSNEEATTLYNPAEEVEAEDDELAAVLNSEDEDTEIPVEEVVEEVVADYEVESITPVTMYAIQSVNLRQGPDATDFVKVGSLSARESVTVVGKVTTYKGKSVLWYQTESGSFVSGAYLSDTKPAAPTPSKPSGGGNGGGNSAPSGGSTTPSDSSTAPSGGSTTPDGSSTTPDGGAIADPLWNDSDNTWDEASRETLDDVDLW